MVLFIAVVVLVLVVLLLLLLKNTNNSQEINPNSDSETSSSPGINLIPLSQQQTESKPEEMKMPAETNTKKGEYSLIVPLEFASLTPETATKPFTVKVKKDDGFETEVIVVNKKHPLPKEYSPGESEEAVEALKQLIEAGKKAGIDLVDRWSGFRSFQRQTELYDGYVASSGKAKADTFSARPGYSEHQTGFAFDLLDSSGNLYNPKNYSFETDWVAKNCADFGFILRYRDEWQHKTGYVGEPWHLRYLGEVLAKAVTNSNSTLEEFLGVASGDYSN